MLDGVDRRIRGRFRFGTVCVSSVRVCSLVPVLPSGHAGITFER